MGSSRLAGVLVVVSGGGYLDRAPPVNELDLQVVRAGAGNRFKLRSTGRHGDHHTVHVAFDDRARGVLQLSRQVSLADIVP